MNSPAAPAKRITVSVLLATYNRAHYLPEALESILQQTRPPEEIIVIDDGSSDHTPEVMRRYLSGIRYFRTENRGKAAALNFAIPLAQGSHIWIFDDDDVALPDALQAHVDFLDTHPGVDFSYSTNYRYSGDGDIWQRDKWVSKAIPDWPPEVFAVQVMWGLHTLFQGMVIPKRCFVETGLFDEALLRVQDTEMLIKLAHRFRAQNIKKPTFVLRDHGGARGPNTHGDTESRRNAIQLRYQQQVFRKVRAAYPLPCYLPHEPGQTLPVLNEAERGQALIQRGCVMLRQGLTDLALSDLREGLGLLNAIEQQSREIAAILSKAVNIEPWILPRRYYLISALAKVFRKNHCEALAIAVTRGVYWTLLRSLRRHQWRNAVQAFSMLLFTAFYSAQSLLTHLLRSCSISARMS